MFWLAIGIVTLAAMAVGALIINVLWIAKFGPDKLGAAYYRGFSDGTRTAQRLAQEAMFGPPYAVSKPRIPQNPYRLHGVDFE